MSDSSERSDTRVEEMEEGELVEAFRDYVDGIVEKIWRRGTGHGLSKSDLQSYGFRGLLEAFRNYDADRDNEFATYAYRRIRGEILDGLRRFRRAPRGRSTRERDDVGPRRANRVSRSYRESADEVTLRCESAANPLDATVCTYLMAPSDMENLEFGCDGKQEEEVAARDRQRVLRDAMAELSDFERRVVRLYDLEGCTMEEVAEATGCSKSWAARIRERAHDRMKEHLTEEADGGANPSEASDRAA